MHSGHMTFGPIDLEEVHGAHNYHPLPVMVSHGEGAWVTDDDGQRYLDFLAAYSALNFGHRHPTLVAAAQEQLDRLTLTSRAFHHDLLGPFCAELAELAGKEMVLPMNSGAEGVETALKVARRWGYEVKGVPDGRGHDRRDGRQLPRPHDQHRQLLRRPRRQGPLRPLHARLPLGAVRRRRRARRRDRRDDRGRPGRAGAGRGRRDRAAGGLPARGASGSASSTRC